MKSLPHRPEAEAAILGGIVLRGHAAMLEVADIVREEDFFVPAHQAVFRAMRRLAERAAPIDLVTLEQDLKEAEELKLAGGVVALTELADRYGSARNVAHHAEQVRRVATVRASVLAAEAIVEEGLADPPDVAAYLDRNEERILSVQLRDRVRGPATGRALMLNTIARLKTRTGGSAITGVTTGFPDLDDLLKGLQPGDLVILAARPSMGKTALALNIAEAAAVLSWQDALEAPERRRQLEPAYIASIEMSEEQLAERILASQARVDGGRMRSGAFIADDWERMLSAGKRIAESPIHVDDLSSPTILEVRARARRWRRDRKVFDDAAPCRRCGTAFDGPRCPAPRCGWRRPCGLVVVDYLQLVRGAGSRYASREAEVAEVSRGLKAMAKELSVPVLALSQLNRAVEGRADHRPQLSDLRESGAIEQDADVILFVHREERFIAAADEEKRRAVEGQADVIVGKQRNGPIGEVKLTFLKHLTRFESRHEER